MLEYERQVEILKDSCPENILKGLTNLYSDAIEYFGYLDDHTKCTELQMRMQSILVRPYVLDCLARFEKAQKAADRQAADPVDLKSATQT